MPANQGRTKPMDGGGLWGAGMAPYAMAPGYMGLNQGKAQAPEEGGKAAPSA
jgi:hypothetical protein